MTSATGQTHTHPPGQLTQSVAELNARVAWFADPARTPEDNIGPHVRVVDNFYSDPYAVRDAALTQNYFQYNPPLAEQVGAEVAESYRAKRGTWLTTRIE